MGFLSVTESFNKAIHLVLAAIGFILMLGLFLLSFGTDGMVMAGIGAAVTFLNLLVFLGLFYAIRE